MFRFSVLLRERQMGETVNWGATAIALTSELTTTSTTNSIYWAYFIQFLKFK